MKYLLTGASGFIGSHLVELLLSKQNEVYIVDINDKFFFEHENLKILHSDINNTDEILSLISSIQPDVIYHLAAQSFPKIAWEQPQFTMMTNLIGTINLLEAVRKQNKLIKLIAAGSSAEYAQIRAALLSRKVIS